MRMKRHYSVFILLFLLMLQLSCDIDHGLAPLPGKLELTVIFRNEPPDETQGIYLTVMPDFPPHAINQVYHSPNSLPIDQDTVHTEIVLPFGSYDAIALWWYSTEVESNLADILAIPIDFTTGFNPLGFELTESEPVKHVTIIANWAKVDRDAAIEGTIHFNDDFPTNTQITAVAAFSNQPQSDIDYLMQLKSVDLTIDVNENPYHYRLPVKSGKVGYIAVYWLPERSGLGDLIPIGEYRDPEDSTQIGSIRPGSGETIKGLDIHADWNRVPEGMAQYGSGGE